MVPDRCTNPTCEQHWPVEVALSQINPEWSVRLTAFDPPPSGTTIWEDIQRAAATVAAADPHYQHDCRARHCIRDSGT